MKRSILFLAVAMLLLVALPALAQQGPGAPGQGRGQEQGLDRDNERRVIATMMRLGGMMMQAPPAIAVAGERVYIVFMGQLIVLNAESLEVIKVVPLPRPEMGGFGGRGAGREGRPGGAGAPGNPPPPAQ